MDVERLKRTLARDERTLPMVYDDATGKVLKPGDTLKGVPTFGIGHNGYRGLSARAMNVILEDDIEETLRDLDRVLPWWRDLDEVRQEAMANMAFNLGLTHFLTFKNMLAALERGDWQGAHDEALASLWAKQVGARADRIALEYRDGIVRGL